MYNIILTIGGAYRVINDIPFKTKAEAEHFLRTRLSLKVVPAKFGFERR